MRWAVAVDSSRTNATSDNPDVITPRKTTVRRRCRMGAVIDTALRPSKMGSAPLAPGGRRFGRREGPADCRRSRQVSHLRTGGMPQVGGAADVHRGPVVATRPSGLAHTHLHEIGFTGNCGSG